MSSCEVLTQSPVCFKHEDEFKFCCIPEQASQIFSDDWQTYEKLLEGNYMHHVELYSALQQYMERSTQGQSFSVLDLGCGDSYYVAKMLRHSPLLSANLASYTGVDMSLPALTLSTQYIRSATANPAATVVHQQADMLKYVRNACPDQKFDFVLASFSVHHLAAVEKQELMKLVLSKLLKPGGAFCLVDVFLEQGENRMDFLHRSKAAYDSATLFSEEEKKKMFAHTEECDYPESLDTYASWAAGLCSNLQLLVGFDLFKAVTIQL